MQSPCRFVPEDVAVLHGCNLSWNCTHRLGLTTAQSLSHSMTWAKVRTPLAQQVSGRPLRL